MKAREEITKFSTLLEQVFEHFNNEIVAHNVDMDTPLTLKQVTDYYNKESITLRDFEVTLARLQKLNLTDDERKALTICEEMIQAIRDYNQPKPVRRLVLGG